MDFLEKLDFLMERFNLTKTSLSQKSGIPYTTIDAWYKKGYEGLKLTTLRKLASYFNTTLDYWFLDEITDPNYGKSSSFKVEYNEMEYIKKYRSLDSFGQETVSYILDRETERVKQIQKKELGITEFENPNNSMPRRLISYYYKNASAGTGQLIIDNLPEEDIEIPDIPQYRNVSYAIGVNGSSMEPVYHDGDILLVEATREIQIGEIGIFQINNESFVKKLGENELISLNPDYKNIPLNESAGIMGKVIDVLKN